MTQRQIIDKKKKFDAKETGMKDDVSQCLKSISVLYNVEENQHG